MIRVVKSGAYIICQTMFRIKNVNIKKNSTDLKHSPYPEKLHRLIDKIRLENFSFINYLFLKIF